MERFPSKIEAAEGGDVIGGRGRNTIDGQGREERRETSAASDLG